MLLQTNSYIVPRDKSVEHARLLRRFRQTLLRLGCDHFEVYEQTGANWSSADNSGRFVQIMRFRDRKHQLAVQNAEKSDASAQALLREFCDLINLPYQQQQGLFAVGFYTSFMRMPEVRHDAAAPALGSESHQEQTEPGDAVDAASQESGNGKMLSPEGDEQRQGDNVHRDFADDISDSEHPASDAAQEQDEQAEDPTFPSNS